MINRSETALSELEPAHQNLIPWDKSRTINAVILYTLDNSTEGIDFLADQDPSILSDDLHAVLRASRQWLAGDPIETLESASVFRRFQMAAWELGENRIFIKSGTLKNRQIIDDSEIIHLPLNKLAELDGGTTQWVSAALLMGRDLVELDLLSEIPFKVKETLKAINDWKLAQVTGKPFEFRKDGTLANQARAFIQYHQSGEIDFVPEQPEDYPTAFLLDVMTRAQAEKTWAQLKHHESDRFDTMDRVLATKRVDVPDHRPIFAAKMMFGNLVTIVHPKAVKKSWVQFFDFYDLAFTR